MSSAHFGRPCRIALVGAGKMGLLHASLLNVMPGVRLVAFCEKSALIRRFGGKALGTPLVSDIQQLASLDLDAVYVTTPPSSHAAVIKAVLSESIAPNIFVEKPLAASGDEAEDICRLVEGRGAGGVHMAGYNRRFGGTFLKAREILEAGDIGSLRSFEAYAYSSDFAGAKSTRRRGSVLRDLGCHSIDLALWFFGGLEVLEVGPLGAGPEAISDSASFKARTATGVEGEFSASWSMEAFRLPEVGLVIHGSLGTLRVNDDVVELESDGGNSRRWHHQDLDDGAPFLLGGPDYFRENEAFLAAIADGNGIEPGFQSAARVDRIIDQVEEGAMGLGG